jgi:hypothetical protein
LAVVYALHVEDRFFNTPRLQFVICQSKNHHHYLQQKQIIGKACEYTLPILPTNQPFSWEKIETNNEKMDEKSCPIKSENIENKIEINHENNKNEKKNEKMKLVDIIKNNRNIRVTNIRDSDKQDTGADICVDKNIDIHNVDIEYDDNEINKRELGELLMGFFNFYGTCGLRSFDL